MDSRPRIVVVGSSNTDLTARVSRLPAPGETVLGNDFTTTGGGKGANQAAAAARLGASVTFIARVGKDVYGDNAIAAFDAEGIDTRFIIRDETAPSGIALIGVDETTGENAIIVASGANANLSVADIERARNVIEAAQVLICQLETPMETVCAALKIAYEEHVETIVNPAPAQRLSLEMLRMIHYLTPNESELKTLGGDAKALCIAGVGVVIITQGAAGATVTTKAKIVSDRIAGRCVENVIDTTAAGDCFNGAFAVAIAEKNAVADAVEFANAAAALSVTKAGAQPSLPMRAEVEAFLSRQ